VAAWRAMRIYPLRSKRLRVRPVAQAQLANLPASCARGALSVLSRWTRATARGVAVRTTPSDQPKRCCSICCAAQAPGVESGMRPVVLGKTWFEIEIVRIEKLKMTSIWAILNSSILILNSLGLSVRSSPPPAPQSIAPAADTAFPAAVIQAPSI